MPSELHFYQRLLAALDALPEKGLIAGHYLKFNGGCCAMGAMILNERYRHRVVPESEIPPEDFVEKVVDVNDDGGPADETPAQRWTRMRAWTEAKIKECAMSEEEQKFRLAAKACGKDLTGWQWDAVASQFTRAFENGVFYDIEYWNPRDDDGDSRRLQVDARIDVNIYEDFAQALHIDHGAEVSLIDEWVNFSDTDKHAATRLAVLNCAVATGEAEPVYYARPLKDSE